MILADRICSSNQFQKEASRIRKVYKDFEINIKYKTEICKNWLSGSCKFGTLCIFAHGNQEIKVNLPHRTKECNKFKKHYWCPYGEKCQFKHTQAEIKRPLSVFLNILLKSEADS